MSQHQIEVDSPKVGRLFVTVGYDPRLDDAFLNYFNDTDSFMSPAGCSVEDLQKISQAELGMELPQQLIDAVGYDLADLRLGATDVGRRIVQYCSDGSVKPAGQA